MYARWCGFGFVGGQDVVDRYLRCKRGLVIYIKCLVEEKAL